MAAIAQPFGQMWQPKGSSSRESALRLVREPTVQQTAVRSPHRRHRGAVPLMATIGLLVATWFGTGAISGAGAGHLRVLAHSVKVQGGYSYVVQPGDTLWSIATRLDPNGDPRPLVDRLTAEVRGATIQPGQRLLVP